MLTRTLCLAVPAPIAQAVPALEAAAAQALRELPGLQRVLVNRVVRQIPTDYIANDRPYAGVVAEADDITATLALQFEGAAAARAALGGAEGSAFLARVRAAGRVLFMLDSEANVPVALTGSAVQGGFRRWLLLTRNAPTIEGFRDAWFERHASLVKHLPLLEGYVQNLVTARYDASGAPVGHEALPIDGVAEVCYADEEAMNRSYASDARLPLKDDGAALNKRVSTLLVQGRVLQ
ncbi:EthD domain-containing protein [Variovorax sp. 770b2]|uniref:EthD domain-containing protein n=1 Tax=Variovorax sp. 770b2 TaxID=1566271 RepID=UPI0008E2D74F|nr:EthD domain-containing protein [Variovorax sp. 770b2]SFP25677.1 EthD domain-containing protein [Variovorax sp. 770b2]